ncbi:MAG: YraN family protein [Alphaproteobacteria bacterium]|nr:YraN family protein [Alphaproteobacteria bacterium]
MSPRSSGRARVRALGRGRRAETAAALYLMCKGYRILSRSFRTQLGEIDIVARRGTTLAMVEVKYRPARAEAAYAITPAQRQRIELAARGFLAAHPQYADHHVRFDALLLAPWRWPLHLTDAWRD